MIWLTYFQYQSNLSQWSNCLGSYLGENKNVDEILWQKYLLWIVYFVRYFSYILWFLLLTNIQMILVLWNFQNFVVWRIAQLQTTHIFTYYGPYPCMQTHKCVQLQMNIYQMITLELRDTLSDFYLHHEKYSELMLYMSCFQFFNPIYLHNACGIWQVSINNCVGFQRIILLFLYALP